LYFILIICFLFGLSNAGPPPLTSSPPASISITGILFPLHFHHCQLPPLPIQKSNSTRAHFCPFITAPPWNPTLTTITITIPPLPNQTIQIRYITTLTNSQNYHQIPITSLQFQLQQQLAHILSP
jgi:hypothetical protein